MYSFHVPITTVHDTPDESSECVTEGLMGEDYSILEDIDDSWLKITLRSDSYTGYIKRPCASSKLNTNYRVCSRTTLLFTTPSIKSRVVWRIPFNAQLEIVDSKETDFKTTADGLYVWHTHVCPVSTIDKRSPIELIESCFLDAPYLGAVVRHRVLIVRVWFNLCFKLAAILCLEIATSKKTRLKRWQTMNSDNAAIWCFGPGMSVC